MMHFAGKYNHADSGKCFRENCRFDFRDYQRSIEKEKEMKEIGYLVFAFLYRIFKLFPVKRNSAFFIMTHDGGREGKCSGNCSLYEKGLSYKIKSTSEKRYFF